MHFSSSKTASCQECRGKLSYSRPTENELWKQYLSFGKPDQLKIWCKMLKGIESRKIWILTQSQREFKDFVVSSFFSIESNFTALPFVEEMGFWSLYMLCEVLKPLFPLNSSRWCIQLMTVLLMSMWDDVL